MGFVMASDLGLTAEEPTAATYITGFTALFIGYDGYSQKARKVFLKKEKRKPEKSVGVKEKNCKLF